MDQNLGALKEEIKNRAKIYVKLYEQLAAELGAEKAAEVFGRAVYERGRDKGEALAEKIGAPDLEKLARAFVEGNAEASPFGQEVVEVSDTRALLRLNGCPLVEAWDELGLSADEKKKMCNIACQVDFGKFETAGYTLKFNCRIAEGADSCDMELTK